jgi:glutathione S-transferase
LEQKRVAGYAALGVMEGHLASRRFFVAETYTIADMALYAYTHVAHEGGFDLSGYPAVKAWLDRVAAQPGHVPITAAS